ncbi:hypothetical protein [Streptomyces sp. NPDC051662]|uniref:hypothetical protein n=1 Tax=Streptomyces sp. NPDC051662 TaxID=3154750 RepID=UPI00341D339B
MISEPELEGEDGGAPRPPDGSETVGAGGDDLAHRRNSPALPPRRVRWLWALGGAVVASAVWAGGLYAYDRTAADLGGYRISEDLCLDADLSALSKLLGPKRSPQPAVEEQHAIDRSFCNVTMMKGRPHEVKDDALPSSYSSVVVNYTLHKETDPAPEFDATLTPLAVSRTVDRKTKRIPELGERAYLMTDSAGFTPELKVLDGRAVLSIEVMSEYVAEGPHGAGQPVKPERVDPAALELALVEDMKTLMAAVKK